MNSWCEAGATLRDAGRLSGRSGERGARRRGLRGERKAVVEAEDWEGPAFTGPVRASASILAGDRGQFERVVVHQFAISQRPLGQISVYTRGEGRELLSSFFSWVDFAEEDRRKMSEVIALFRQVVD
jgi:hypothetical protein